MINSFRLVSILLLLAFFTQVFLWSYTRHIQPSWINVPPPPSAIGAAGIGLGDKQLAYRAYGITMQSLGDKNVKSAALSDLNYVRLGKWFDVMDLLEPKSNFMPMMVAYYFASTNDLDQLDPVIEYLRRVGLRDAHMHKKWRWLVNAIFFAKHKQKDTDKALAMAYELSALADKGVELPIWAVNMPAMIKLEQGDKQSAYQMTIRILQDGAEDMHPNEVNFMIDYLCNRILDEAESVNHPVCQ
jgi:hypothetical protein